MEYLRVWGWHDESHPAIIYHRSLQMKIFTQYICEQHMCEISTRYVCIYIHHSISPTMLCTGMHIIYVSMRLYVCMYIHIRMYVCAIHLVVLDNADYCTHPSLYMQTEQQYVHIWHSSSITPYLVQSCVERGGVRVYGYFLSAAVRGTTIPSHPTRHPTPSHPVHPSYPIPSSISGASRQCEVGFPI